MKKPLIIFAVDDGSIGVFTDEKLLFNSIEAIDASNYRVYDSDGFQQEIHVIPKKFLGIPFGNEMKLSLKIQNPKKITEDERLVSHFIDLLRKLDKTIELNDMRMLPYMLDLLMSKIGCNKFYS